MKHPARCRTPQNQSGSSRSTNVPPMKFLSVEISQYAFRPVLSSQWKAIDQRREFRFPNQTQALGLSRFYEALGL